MAGVTPFEVHHGAPARPPFPGLAEETSINEDEEMKLPSLFAEATAVSTKVFCQLARTHDEFVRHETAFRLNKAGGTRMFQIGDKVKIRVPPTQEQMLSTGRRAKHITAWRGPCTVVDRLSPTSYAAVDDVTKRRYERVIANMLSYRAKRSKTNDEAGFNETYSDAFAIDEYIAIRDDAVGPFYVARITAISTRTVTLHYYGCREVILQNAVFCPAWHRHGSDAITLSHECPENLIAYSGIIQLKTIRHVLVARHLDFTSTGKLRFRAQRALAPVQDQLFRFSR